MNTDFPPSLLGPTTLFLFPLPSAFAHPLLQKCQRFPILNLSPPSVHGVGPGRQRIMAIAGLQVQPPCHRFTRTFSSGNHLLSFYLFCLLSLPLLEQKLHTGVGVLTSEGLSECSARGRLYRLKSELQCGAQGFADAKHKKSNSYHHNFPSTLRSRGIECFKLSCFL